MEVEFDLTEIDSIAQKIIQESSHKVFLFYGEMGSGKTTLIKTIINQLGVQDHVSSPTYSIVQEYQLDNGSPIFHFDFYRIKDYLEALEIGFEDYIDQDAYIFIEWPEIINKHLTNKVHKIEINTTKSLKRKLIFQ